MKKTLTLISLLLAISANSQISYVDTDWAIDQTIVMENGVMDTLQLDFDSDGQVDMRISSWSNHQNGITTAMEVLMPHGLGFGGLQVSQSTGYLADCPASGYSYQNLDGYLFTSDQSNPYANQYVKIPFRFQDGAGGTHNGILYVRYVGTTITVEGYAWNSTVNGPCDCSSTSWLSLEKTNPSLSNESFYYADMLGKQVDKPSGLILKVYESGYSEKVFITN